MSDDGQTDHCGCCSHSRRSGCGGPACPCATASRRAPVQRDGWSAGDKPPGTIAWSEHLEAYVNYALRYPGSARIQDAEVVARRGGFSYRELVDHLGHRPTTWRVNDKR